MMKTFLLCAFIAGEVLVFLKILSRYSAGSSIVFFDTRSGFVRLTLVLTAIVLPFFLFVIALFSPGTLRPLLTNPWFYFLLFLVSIVFSVITQDVLRTFGDRLSASVHWFDGWRGLVRLYLLVCAVLLPALWLVLLLLDDPVP